MGKAAFGKVLELYETGVVAPSPSPASASRARFYDSQALFGLIDNLGYFVHCPFEYGIVPLPAGNTLTGYRSPPWAYRAFCMQEANGDWEKSCFILGKAAEAFGDVNAGIESLYKYVQDAESKEMIREYILPGLYLSIAEISSDKTVSLFNSYYVAMYDGDRTLAAQYAKQHVAAVAEAFKLFDK